MATTLSYTYTGTYSSSKRSITAWIRYTWYPYYTATTSRLVIHSMGVRNNSGSDMLWGTSSTNGPKYISVWATGKSAYKIDRTSTSFNWDNNYDYWNFVTNGRNASMAAWDGSTATYWDFSRSASGNSTIYIYGHIYKKGAWAVNTDFGGAALTIPAQTFTISYNANGGSGAPANGTKTGGQTYTLATGIPTRVGYDFLGWSQSSTATLPTHRYGPNHDYATTYTTNSTTTFYAIWHPSFSFPKIEDLRAYRIDDNTTTFSPSVKSDGTRCYTDFKYTEPTNYNTVNLSVLFTKNDTLGTIATEGSYKYAYTGNNHLSKDETEQVIVTITGTKYTYEINGVVFGGESFTIYDATSLTKAIVLWDAYKDNTSPNDKHHHDPDYQSFAFGQAAREGPDDYPVAAGVNGDVDFYFNATFINDLNIHIDVNAGTGADYRLKQNLIRLGWYAPVSQGGVMSDKEEVES